MCGITLVINEFPGYVFHSTFGALIFFLLDHCFFPGGVLKKEYCISMHNIHFSIFNLDLGSCSKHFRCCHMMGLYFFIHQIRCTHYLNEKMETHLMATSETPESGTKIQIKNGKMYMLQRYTIFLF